MLELRRAYYVPLTSGRTYARESNIFIGQNFDLKDLDDFWKREIRPEITRRDYIVIDLFRVNRAGENVDNRRYVISFCRNGYKGLQEMKYNGYTSEFDIVNISEFAIEEMDDLKQLLLSKITLHIVQDLKDEIEIHRMAEDMEREINNRL